MINQKRMKIKINKSINVIKGLRFREWDNKFGESYYIDRQRGRYR
jgi:hypothetical protein